MSSWLIHQPDELLALPKAWLKAGISNCRLAVLGRETQTLLYRLLWCRARVLGGEREGSVLHVHGRASSNPDPEQPFNPNPCAIVTGLVSRNTRDSKAQQHSALGPIQT